MLVSIHPKLPMRDLSATRTFYTKQLGFEEVADFGNYYIVRKDNIEIHFFFHEHLVPEDNYGQVYIKSDDIDHLYEEISEKVLIHPNGHLKTQPWGMQEFSILDPDHNLVTFGQQI